LLFCHNSLFEFAQHYLQLRTISLHSYATVEWEQWAVEDSDTMKDSEAVGNSLTL